MENDIIDALNTIGYNGPMLEKKFLMTAVAGGAKNVDYTELVHYLANELHVLCNIDECVNAIKSPEDSSSFLLELSSFLKELQCPFTNLTQGHVTDRLGHDYDKLLLLDYLISELMAARMVNVNKPEQKIELQIHESPVANNLKHILLALKFNKPPPNITALVLFQKLESKLQETVKRAGPELCGNPIFKHTLSDKEWEKLGKVQEDLNADYKIRREMLLKRLDCTVQSFQWSDRVKGKEDKIAQIFCNKRKQLIIDPEIDLSDLMAARDDLAIIEKTSSASVRKNTQTALTKHIIGPVPDRGGRPSEQAPPPPEMPSWQQRSSGPSGGGGRGRGGGGRGGSDNYSRGGGGRGGNDNYSRGSGNDSFRGRGNDNYSRGGGNSYNQSYSDNRGSSNYNQGYSDNRSSGYDNRGKYGDNRGGNENRGNYGDNRGGNYNSSRGGYSDRRSSYDNYQVNKTTYAEQYVQESQHNQQYRGGSYDSQRGQQRGRSNYNRGGYR